MMLMGRSPANPLKLLRDTWSGENQLPQTTGKSVSEFLAELQTQIQKTHDFADEHAAVERATKKQSINIFRLDNKSLC